VPTSDICKATPTTISCKNPGEWRFKDVKQGVKYGKIGRGEEKKRGMKTGSGV